MDNRIWLPLFLVLAACSNNPGPATDPCADDLTATFEPCQQVTPVPGQCHILEALVTDSSGYVIDKFVYHYDGTHYDRIDRYYTDENTQPLPDSPREIHSFAYQDGLISEVSHTAPSDSPGTTWVTTYTYEDDKVKLHDEIHHDGSVEYENDREQFYIRDPQDSTYFYDGSVVPGFDGRALFEYKGSNLVRMAYPSDDGTCTIHNIQWHFVRNYFDDVPNVLKDFAVRYPFLIGKGIYGAMLNTVPTYPLEVNANNIIGRVEHDGASLATSPYCWAYLKSNQTYYIKSFERMDPDRKITYYYDCE